MVGVYVCMWYIYVRSVCVCVCVVVEVRGEEKGGEKKVEGQTERP